MDLLSTALQDDEIIWWKSDGNRPPSFTKQVIVSGNDMTEPTQYLLLIWIMIQKLI